MTTSPDGNKPSLIAPIVWIVIGLLIYAAEKDNAWDEPWMFINGALVVGVGMLIYRLIKR